MTPDALSSASTSYVVHTTFRSGIRAQWGQCKSYKSVSDKNSSIVYEREDFPKLERTVGGQNHKTSKCIADVHVSQYGGNGSQPE